MLSFKEYLKIESLKEEVSDYEVVETTEELSESFISHSDFEEKLKNHKSHGHVIHHDYDHRAKKAVIRHVDADGEVREFKYHDKGTTVHRLAPMGNKVHETEDGQHVTKHSAPGYQKRGRGRPAGPYKGEYKKRAKKAVSEEVVDESTGSNVLRHVNRINDTQYNDDEAEGHKQKRIEKHIAKGKFGKATGKKIADAAATREYNDEGGYKEFKHRLKSAIHSAKKTTKESFELDESRSMSNIKKDAAMQKPHLEAARAASAKHNASKE